MNIDAALEIKKKFNLSEDDVMFAVKDGLIGRFAKIKEKDFDNVDGVKEKFNLSDDFFKTAIKEGFFSALERNSPFMAVKIKERFNLSDDFIKSDKVISAVAQKAQYRMYHDIDDAILLKEKFSLPEDISIDVAKNGMVNMLTDQRTVVEIDWHRSDAISKAMEIKEKFGLSKEASDSSVKTAMINSFRHHGDGITFAVEMKDAFNLSDEIVQEAVKEGIVDSFLSGGVVYGIGLGEKFNLPENMVRDIAKSVMLGKMDEEEGDNWECIRELREKFNLYKEYDDEIKIQKDK
jgi:hypothetical protein